MLSQLFQQKTFLIRQYRKGVFHGLARQKGSEIVPGHMASDHVLMCVPIPPKYAVSEVIGYLKGKSTIAVARQYGGQNRNFNGEKHMGTRICCVNSRF